MVAVDPNGCVQITVAEGDRVVQVIMNKISQSLKIHVNERVSNIRVIVTKTAWILTDQYMVTAKERSNRIARAMTSSKNPQIHSQKSRAEEAQ